MALGGKPTECRSPHCYQSSIGWPLDVSTPPLTDGRPSILIYNIVGEGQPGPLVILMKLLLASMSRGISTVIGMKNPAAMVGKISRKIDSVKFRIKLERSRRANLD